MSGNVRVGLFVVAVGGAWAAGCDSAAHGSDDRSSARDNTASEDSGASIASTGHSATSGNTAQDGADLPSAGAASAQGDGTSSAPTLSSDGATVVGEVDGGASGTVGGSELPPTNLDDASVTPEIADSEGMESPADAENEAELDAGEMFGNPSALDAGAADSSPLLDSIAPGSYGTAADLPQANSEMAVAALDGKIYVVGGYPSSRETQDTVQVYDTRSDSWELARSLPEPIHHPVLVGVGGRLYSLGGQPNTARALVYDPQIDEWSDLAPMPTARGAGAGAVIGDRIYVVGGRSPAQNEFEVYDISDDAWQVLPTLPRDYDTRNHLAAAAIDDKVYVAGGRYDGDGFSSPMTDALDVYDPATNEWTRLASMLLPRGGVNGIAVNGCFHVWGGEGTNTGYPNDVFPNHDVYNPVSNEWSALPDLPIPVHGVTGAAVVDDLIYIPGGGTSSGGTSGSRHFQVYRPQTSCDE